MNRITKKLIHRNRCLTAVKSPKDKDMPFVLHEWMMVAYSCFTGVMAVSFIYSGHLFVEDLRDMFDMSYKVVSLIPGIWNSSGYMGFIPAIMFRRLGYRYSLMGFAFLICLSFVGAAFSPSCAVVMLLLGGIAGPLMGGAGVGMIYVLNGVIAPERFHKAVSICSTVSSLGLLAAPHVYRMLVDYYSVRGAFMVFGALLLHICVAAVGFPNQKPIVKKEADGSVGRTKWELCKEPKFLLVNILLAIDSISFSAYNGFSMSLFTTDFKIEEYTASMLVSITGGLSALGRLSVCLMGPNMRMNRFTVQIIMMLCQGIVVLIMGSLSHISLAGCYILGSVFWLSTAAAFTLQGIVVSELFPDSFDVAFSILLFNGCIFMISTPFVVGAIVDVTGSFRTPMLMAGALKVVACGIPLLWTGSRTVRNIRKGNTPLMKLEDTEPG